MHVNYCAHAARQISLYWTMTALAGIYSCLIATLMWQILQLLNITYWMDQLYLPISAIVGISILTFQIMSVTHRRELFPIFYPHFTLAWQHAVRLGRVKEI